MIEENEIINEGGKVEIIKIEEETTFDKIKKIQKLVKKESALKEICKQNLKLKYIIYFYSYNNLQWI